MAIVLHLDVELAKRKMSVTDLAAAVGITTANISILKNGRAKAVRFSTLDAICTVLRCQPGDILSHVPDGEARPGAEDGPDGEETGAELIGGVPR
ncbi:helix-turn-helix transcriptional regulator [Rathayibacter sp. VKM Ac-2856]|uniref:helix-turn-helix domain-containing protein n=1 Tax=unclassified Rathayibacter TaxID=2609250 RepID=UPI001564ABD3|nr:MULTISPECIES: helix-turn-helix transcriptional regulator [unclassified Rathayibacter]NQX04813.1 helix-turn-helix transcriptional regulator [Rathayibacter sp. VKM Ac-2858]NQX19981.1 helix-turn-helix transcriptional regulator [Rathayibacter sp. VKM Ac-2856]